MRTVTCLLSLVLTSPALAQPELNVLPSAPNQPAPNKMLHDYLRREAQKHFDSRRSVVAGLKTPQEVQARQKMLKANFIESIGGFPEKTPLKPQVVGTLKADGYRVERLIYESRPDHHVTANLYLPEGAGPFPGVLMPLGHYNNGKAADEVQRGCILLAKSGFAVLVYDPIGQGERMQLVDSKGKPAIAGNTTEHSLIGVGALLIGENCATYRIWDGIRSMDYLAGRPEVDPKRLGCTGCSGGGTLTSYLMALDDRIQCAAVSCYLTTFERLFDTIGPQDAEQNITGQVAFGMDHADYVTMRAPRPTLICAATKDFFDIQGTWTTFREASQIYALMGHPERVALAEANTGHGFSKLHREAVVRWMSRWLQGKDSAVIEPNFPVAKDADLQCTRSGQVLDDFKGKSAFNLNADRARELAKQRASQFATRTPAELQTAVRQLIALPKTITAAKLADRGKVDRPTYEITKVAFDTEPGITVPGLWFKPKNPAGKRRLVLYIHGNGKTADAGPGGAIEKLVQAGDEVLALDLRGFGETAPNKPAKKPGFFGTDANQAWLALHLNRPLLGQRVYDILAVVQCLAQDKATPPLHIIGIGTATPIVQHAAALEPLIKGVTVEGGIGSWLSVVYTPLAVNQLTNVVPGALRVYDLQDLKRQSSQQ
jgi:cephalosporin-C deacetylase-like acetyl esterase